MLTCTSIQDSKTFWVTSARRTPSWPVTRKATLSRWGCRCREDLPKRWTSKASTSRLVPLLLSTCRFNHSREVITFETVKSSLKDSWCLSPRLTLTTTSKHLRDPENPLMALSQTTKMTSTQTLIHPCFRNTTIGTKSSHSKIWSTKRLNWICLR
jgi:hypothetical protein